MEKNEKGLTVLLTPSLLDQLKRLASENGRSLSGEARMAISLYVEEEEEYE